MVWIQSNASIEQHHQQLAEHATRRTRLNHLTSCRTDHQLPADTCVCSSTKREAEGQMIQPDLLRPRSYLAPWSDPNPDQERVRLAWPGTGACGSRVSTQVAQRVQKRRSDFTVHRWVLSIDTVCDGRVGDLVNLHACDALTRFEPEGLSDQLTRYAPIDACRLDFKVF